MTRQRSAAVGAAGGPAAGGKAAGGRVAGGAAGGLAAGGKAAGGVAGGPAASGRAAVGSAAGGRATGRKGDPWRTAFFGVMAVAIVAGVAWALLGSGLLVVRSVHAAGTALVSRAEILRAAGIRLGTPLIRVNTAEVARRVEQIPQVQSARVTRAWPDKVVISVLDRTPAVAVAQDGRFALVDKFGVVVRWAAKQPKGMPLLAALAAPASGLRGSAAVRAAVTVLQDLPASLRRRIQAVQAPAADGVVLDLRGGIRIMWGGTDRPAAKAVELAALMRGHATYYDVSDPRTAATGG